MFIITFFFNFNLLLKNNVKSICLLNISKDIPHDAGIKDFRDFKFSEVKDVSIKNEIKQYNFNRDYSFEISLIKIDAFDELNDLETLNLQQSKLSKLKANTFSKLKKLKSLDLSYNQVKLKTNIFNDLENLEVLSLNANDLFQIQKNTFNELKVLKKLTLNRNL